MSINVTSYTLQEKSREIDRCVCVCVWGGGGGGGKVREQRERIGDDTDRCDHTASQKGTPLMWAVLITKV